MRFTRDEIRRSMLLYAVTDRAWLKPGETLPQVAGAVLESGATFLQIREKDLDEAAFAAEAEQLRRLCASSPGQALRHSCDRLLMSVVFHAEMGKYYIFKSRNKYP